MLPHNINSDETTDEQSKDTGDTRDLIGLDRWAGVRSSYTYAGTPDSPQLVVHFAFGTERYKPRTGLKSAHDVLPEADQPAAKEVPAWQQNAINDKELFAEIDRQLTAIYDDKDGSKRTGHVVALSLIDSLLTPEKIELAEKEAQIIRDFVGACLAYLTARVAEKDGGANPLCRLEIPLFPDVISNSKVIYLSLALRLERESHVDPGEEKAAAVITSTETVIPPLTDSRSGTETANSETGSIDTTPSLENIAAFAAAFEKVFLSGEKQMRIGVSASDPRQPKNKPDDRHDSAVYAVRTGIKLGAAINYEVNELPGFFATKPIAGSLASAVVSVSEYKTGAAFPESSEQRAYEGIDLNLWAATALAAIDEFFEPRTAAQAMIVDSLDSADAESEGSVAKILKHKKTISDALAKMIIPVLEPDAGDEMGRHAAQEDYYHSFPAKVSTVSTAVAAIFNGTSVPFNSKDGENVLLSGLYGRLQQTNTGGDAAEIVAADETAEQYNLPISGGIRSFEGGDTAPNGWQLSFLFSPENAGQETAVPKLLEYTLTHAELPEACTPDINESRQSDWIQFVTAQTFTNSGAATAVLPSIARTLPAPPIIIFEQAVHALSAEPAAASTPLPLNLTLWDYLLAFNNRNDVGDSVTASLIFNRKNNAGGTAPGASQNPLFTPLAQFMWVYLQILADFETYLPAISRSSGLQETTVINAKTALATFSKVIGAVAAGYEEWANQSRTTDSGENSLQEDLSFEIILNPDARGNARIDVIAPKDSGELQKIPAPIIRYESYTAIPTADKPDDALVSYNYVRESEQADSADYLTYEQALEISQRSILLKNLNVFTEQNPAAELRIVRNRHLVSGTQTNNEFVFSTVPVKSTGFAQHSLNYGDFDLSTLPVEKPALENYLAVFFDSLFHNAEGIPLELKMTVAHSFQVDDQPDLPRTFMPIMMIPAQSVVPEKGVIAPFITPLASTIREWQAVNMPELNPSSQYNIRLEIFAGESKITAAPLMTVENLFIEAGNIEFS